MLQRHGWNGSFDAAPGGVGGALLRGGTAAGTLRTFACAATGYRKRVVLSSGALSVSVGTAARGLSGVAAFYASEPRLTSSFSIDQ